MNITRYNYEKYFILYLDNELGNEDRRQVELFVNENPDLQQELNWLLQTRLVPDSSVVFKGKEQLFKNPATLFIDTTNYEECLLLYTDNELSDEQKIAVEKFVVTHPAAKAELELLQKTKLQPDAAIVFCNKEILYRKEEKVKVVAMGWRRIAAAAALLLAVSTTALLVLNNKKDTQPGIAAEKSEEKKNIPDSPAMKQPVAETALANAQVADNTNDEIEKKTSEAGMAVAKEKKRVEQKEKTNDLPQPIYNPNVNRVAVQDNPIAKFDPVKESLTIFKVIDSTSFVTPHTTEPLYTLNTSTQADDPFDVNQPGRKNKLRGFFRKVTRTFEKTTNIKATDDEDRLLLGGLAIQL